MSQSLSGSSSLPLSFVQLFEDSRSTQRVSNRYTVLDPDVRSDNESVYYPSNYCNTYFNKCHIQQPNNINSFLVFGDWGELCISQQKQTATIMESYRDVDIVISVGDNFYNPESEKDEQIIDFEQPKISIIDKLNELKKSDIDKYKKQSLLYHIYQKKFKDYSRKLFKYSYSECYPNLVKKPWYLCLGNHDVEPIGKREDMALYQICKDKRNHTLQYCNNYTHDIDMNWNMPSYYWRAIHENVQFIFLDTNMLHFSDINNFEYYINNFYKLLNGQQGINQTLLNTKNRIIEKIRELKSIMEDQNNFAYLSKRDKKMNFYKSGNYGINIDNDIDNQIDWFCHCLLTSKTNWNIVIGHHPPHFYPHNISKSGKNIGLMPNVSIISLIIELYNSINMEKQVQVYFSGHVHNCQIIENNDAKCYEIITGNGGTDLDKTKWDGMYIDNFNTKIGVKENLKKYGLYKLLNNRSNVYDNSHGFLYCYFQSDKLQIRVNDDNGNIERTITISQSR